MYVYGIEASTKWRQLHLSNQSQHSHKFHAAAINKMQNAHARLVNGINGHQCPAHIRSIRFIFSVLQKVTNFFRFKRNENAFFHFESDGLSVMGIQWTTNELPTIFFYLHFLNLIEFEQIPSGFLTNVGSGFYFSRIFLLLNLVLLVFAAHNLQLCRVSNPRKYVFLSFNFQEWMRQWIMNLQEQQISITHSYWLHRNAYCVLSDIMNLTIFTY